MGAGFSERGVLMSAFFMGVQNTPDAIHILAQ
jgi:hypothetical protein